MTKKGEKNIMAKLKNIPLVEIRESPVALRTVDKQSEKYQEMVSSVKAVGILNPILVRTKKDETSGESYYEVIEGLHRTTASRDAGKTEIPAHIMEMEDATVLEAQVIGNFQKVDTKPTQYAEQLKRMLSMNPLMTEGELAEKLGVSRAWIEGRLSLNKIRNEHVQTLINKGQIKLANAYAIAKLPEDEQTEFVEAAMSDDAQEFLGKVNSRLKEVRDAKRKGAAAEERKFEPVAHMRKLKEIREEVDAGLETFKPLIKNVKDVSEAAKIALLWTLHMDDESIAQQKATYDAKEAERKERAEKRQAEALKKKKERAELAAKVAANAQAKMEGQPLPHPEVEEQADANEAKG